MTLQKPKDPSFCIITPTAYMNIYATCSETHLVLAHLVDTNEQYASFYKELSDHGDFIIMDNGAFELGESYEPSILIELANKCGARVIVLPDYPFQKSSKTINAAKEWADKIKDAGFYTMFVPQSQTGDVVDWISAYDWAANSDLIDMIGMSILGIPNAWTNIPAAYARVVATEVLQHTGIFADHKYHHYLGLNAGPKLEIPALIQLGALDSCDSSNPVWMGILGHEYSNNTDSFLSVSKVKKEVDFNYAWNKDRDMHRRILHNIDMTLDLFNIHKKK
jgi:hypothetical protein